MVGALMHLLVGILLLGTSLFSGVRLYRRISRRFPRPTDTLPHTLVVCVLAVLVLASCTLIGTGLLTIATIAQGR